MGSPEELMGTGTLLIGRAPSCYASSLKPGEILPPLVSRVVQKSPSFRWERIPSVRVLPGIARMAAFICLSAWSVLIKSSLFPP